MMAETLAPFPPLVRRMVLRYPRKTVEAVVQSLIDALDTLDGDPDLEPEPLEDDGDAEPIGAAFTH